MTPPDEPDEQPSALSRLERALAGFGDPTRAEAEAEPAADEPATVDAGVTAPDEADAPAEAEAAAEAVEEAADEDLDVEDWAPATVQSAPVLDIASAIDAIEQLSAVQPAEAAAEADAVDTESAIEALERQWAAQEGEQDEAGLPEDEEEEELPRFEPADLRARIKEFAEEDESAEAAAPADGDAGDELVEDADAADEEASAEPLVTRPDAAASWQRDLGDTQLPYFLVEDNRPVGVGPEQMAVPTIEELRRATLIRDEEKEKEPTSVLRTLAEIPILLIVAAVIAFLVKTFLAQAYYIPSGSMLPQLKIDDRVVVSKLAYKAHDPRRGDIIVFDDPREGVAEEKADEGLLRKIGEGIGVVQPSTDEFIKRVIGLPGETVEGRDGHVFINGHRLYEPYLADDVVTSDFPKTRVRAGHLWVMGDNRTGSADSRVFGQIDIDTIVGRAVVTVWPFGNAEFL